MEGLFGQKFIPLSSGFNNPSNPYFQDKFCADKLCWKFSNNGKYQVHKAYDLLSREDTCQSRFFQAHWGWWRSFWKIKVLLKISNFVWKLLNNCLPTFLNLHVRGISTGKLCPMCNEEEESLTHLFLLCPFTRACWHGTTLAIHTSDVNNLPAQLWLKQLISRHDLRDLDSMCYL